MSSVINEYWLVAPLLILGFGALGVMLVDAFSKERAELGLLGAVICAAAALVSAAALNADLSGQGLPEFITRYLAVDQSALYFDIAICLGGGLCSLLAGGYLKEHGFERGEYYVLLLLATLGAVVLARASDLLTLFIGLETMSLGVYCMVAFRRGSRASIEAALKYFLLGSFAAAILLFGGALLYAGTQSTSFTGIAASIAGGEADARLVLLGLFLVIAGFAFKVSAVPFHMWTPDAYEGANTPTTTYMSIVVKTAAFGVFVRFLITGFGDELSLSGTGWPPAIAAIAIMTMIYGNIAAVGQQNLKRMLAYSSIAHAGYVLVGVVASFSPEVSVEAISAVNFYLLGYTVSNVLAFGSLILLGSRGREAVTYDDIRGLGRRNPMAALPFAIAVLSLMGFPPTVGFFGKYMILNATVNAGGVMIWVAVIMVLASAIGAYYYLRVIVVMFMREPEPKQVIAVPMRSSLVTAALLIAAFFVMALGLLPSSALEMATQAASALFAG